ncbi:hypothetical protein [Saccharothrix sp. ALI-22-I]|uniref:hypothetical protein n=1 Tax=Saccharothrix sp. ALI-22-I TaxID=1933778 RepID=UPI0015C36769|nr:hypothetical protein [Saccharothrix sp. ALI-22-I]
MSQPPAAQLYSGLPRTTGGSAATPGPYVHDVTALDHLADYLGRTVKPWVRTGHAKS